MTVVSPPPQEVEVTAGAPFVEVTMETSTALPDNALLYRVTLEGKTGTPQSLRANGSTKFTLTIPTGTAGTLDPLGWGVCHRGHAIYTQGAWEVLQGCLSEISVAPADACDPDLVDACLDDMYEAACERPTNDAFCESFATQCGDGTVNVELCQTELRPFSDAGISDLTSCINDEADPALDCGGAYDFCIGEVLAF